MKKEVALEVAMYPQQSKIPHLDHFLQPKKKEKKVTYDMEKS